MSSPSHKICVIGAVTVAGSNGTLVRLTPGGRQLLSLFVAAGPSGIGLHELVAERGGDERRSDQAVRMAIARLRQLLGAERFPRADDGRYCLRASPTDVDVWHLDHVLHTGDVPTERAVLNHLASGEEPYADCPPSRMLDDSQHVIRRQQTELLILLAQQDPTAIRSDLVDRFIEHARMDPLNEALLSVTAELLRVHGRRPDGLRLIRDAHEAFGETGLELSSGVRSLERELLNGEFARAVTPSSAIHRHATLPAPLAAQTGGRYVGTHRELRIAEQFLDEASSGVSSLLLTGVSGSGKSRLSAEIARTAVKSGWSVELIAPSLQRGGTPWSSLLTAFPDLHEAIARTMFSGGDADSVRVAIWSMARAAVIDAVSGGRLVIVIDDAQWLDDETAEFLGHVMTSRFDGHLLILLNGRSDVGQSESWTTLRDHAVRVGATSIEVSPLDFDGIRSLVDDLRPGMNGALLSAAAREIFERSAGLPGIAIPLLAAMPPDSAVLPSSRLPRGSVPLAPAIESLGPQARPVGIAAAVLGRPFRFEEVVDITELTDESALQALDELVERGLVTDVTLVHFEIAHVLIERSLLEAANRNELANYHRRAARSSATTVHQQARHLAAALPIVPVAEAVAALRASGRLRFEEGAHRESIRQFESVLTLDESALAPADLGNLARSLDLTGMHSQAIARRQVGFDEAVRRGDWDVAFDIAISGLPEAESLDGDPTIVENLQRIDATRLSLSEACRHATMTARQLAILGRDGALSTAHRAFELSDTAAERVNSALVLRLAMSGTTPPSECLDVLRSVATASEYVDDGLRADYLLSVSIDLYQTGQINESAAVLNHFEALTGKTAVKQWQGLLLRSLHQADAGLMTSARDVREQAHRFATDAGLGEADNALLAATFVDVWISGGAAQLAGQVDGGVLDPSDHNLMIMAGAAAALWDAGQHDRAARLAVDAATLAFEGSRPQRLSVLVPLCQPLLFSAHTVLLERTRAALEAAGPSLIVLGAGATTFGPVSRYLARLAEDPAERLGCLSDALAVAERAGSRLWRAVALRDLVEAGQNDRIDDLHALVDDTELAYLIATGS